MLSAERLPRGTKTTIRQMLLVNAAHIFLLRKHPAKYSPKQSD